jgi:hypothetical protein
VALLNDFMATTEQADVHADRWGELLRGGAGELAPAPESSAAVE